MTEIFRYRTIKDAMSRFVPHGAAGRDDAPPTSLPMDKRNSIKGIQPAPVPLPEPPAEEPKPKPVWKRPSQPLMAVPSPAPLPDVDEEDSNSAGARSPLRNPDLYGPQRLQRKRSMEAMYQQTVERATETSQQRLVNR